MAARNYLQLVNAVLNAFNEVELTSTTFPNTVGFYTEVKNAVNQAIFDVYSYELVKWPFLFSSQTITATRGVYKYPTLTPNPDIDWNSFRIARQSYTLTSLTQTGGIATATTNVPHLAITGDQFYIDGADQAGYNTDSVSITVTGPSTFTYQVATTTVSPATSVTFGSLIAKSNTVIYTHLFPVDINEYRMNYANVMENQTSTSFACPRGVVRHSDNSIGIFFAPDRTYTLNYIAFVVPSGLSLYSDTHLIPEKYDQAIVDFALHYCYMFRDNSDEATAATTRAEARIRRMQKDLMPVQTDVNWG